jgi:hypothetical protein
VWNLSTSGSVEERCMGFEGRKGLGVILMEWYGMGLVEMRS